MKLLIASPSQGHFGGMEGFSIGIAAAAQAWPEIELQLCFKLVQKFELKEDLKAATSFLKCPVHFMPSGDVRLLKLVRWADVVHGQNTSPDIVFPSLLWGKKLVLTIHNWRRRNVGIHSTLWGLGAKLAHRRWYNSRFVWDTWEPKRKLAGSECVPTVHGDVLTDSRLPAQWCPIQKRRGFIFIGRWIENKGIEDLVTAYARAKLNPQEWPLTLLGHGPLVPKIKSMVEKQALKGVEMPGFIDSETKARRLASSRWLVAPSRTREDMGVTPIEARSFGVPVIVTRDGGLPESGGPTALIVEPGNIEELTAALKSAAVMSDAEYCERGEEGRKTLKNYLRPMDFYRKSYASILNRN